MIGKTPLSLRQTIVAALSGQVITGPELGDITLHQAPDPFVSMLGPAKCVNGGFVVLMPLSGVPGSQPSGGAGDSMQDRWSTSAQVQVPIQTGGASDRNAVADDLVYFQQQIIDLIGAALRPAGGVYWMMRSWRADPPQPKNGTPFKVLNFNFDVNEFWMRST